MRRTTRWTIGLLLTPVLVAYGLRSADAQATITLEQRVASLELRVATLEAAAATQGQATHSDAPKKLPPTSSDWKDRSVWRYQLKVGLTMDDVKRLLGEPSKVKQLTPTVSWWYYGSYPSDGKVAFTDGRVTSWDEP